MDEITLFAAVRPSAPDFEETERGEVLCRLLAAAASERASDQAAGRSAGPARPPVPARRAWMTRKAGIGVAAAVLAAAAGVLVAVPATGPGTPGARPATASGAPDAAAAVFLRAARAAVAAPELTAGPDQFVYTEQLVEGETYMAINGARSRVVQTPPYLSRLWLSADGQRGEQGTQRNLSGGTWSPKGPVEVMCQSGQRDCTGGYLPDLPGTVGGMLAYLLQSGGPNGPAAYKVLGGIENTSAASGELVPNQSYALMYRVAATVPGIYLVPHVTDSAGEAGIAVAACVPADIGKGSMPGFRGCPERTELIFDAKTYALIGVDNVPAAGRPRLPGRPDSALRQIAVVNNPGQLP
jgi:hypothetical protein